MLQPGPNRLAFQVTVLRQGLYSLKHVLARLGRLSLRLRVALPDDEGPPVELLTTPPLTSVLSETRALAQAVIGDVDAAGSSAQDKCHTLMPNSPLCRRIPAQTAGSSWLITSEHRPPLCPSESPDWSQPLFSHVHLGIHTTYGTWQRLTNAARAGHLREEPVLLNAHACQPRLRLAAIAQKGRLVAGHQNWLGLALQPLHDELLGLRVHAAAAPPAAADPWAASGSGAGNPQDSRCGFCDVFHTSERVSGQVHLVSIRLVVSSPNMELALYVCKLALCSSGQTAGSKFKSCMRASCRCVRQAGSTIGSKTWTTLDSLELMDQPAALMPLEARQQQEDKALTGLALALEGELTPTAFVLRLVPISLRMPAEAQDKWPCCDTVSAAMR